MAPPIRQGARETPRHVAFAPPRSNQNSISSVYWSHQAECSAPAGTWYQSPGP
jgi:hypothetical protein